jgi:signal transduction histidine kinase
MLKPMITRFNDLSIRTKFILGLGMLVVLVVAVGIVSQITSGIEDREFENLQASERERAAADQIVVEFLEARRNEKDFLFNYPFEGYDNAYTNYYQTSLSHIQSLLDTVEDIRSIGQDQADLDSLDTVETFIIGYRVSLATVVDDSIPTRGNNESGLIGEITTAIEFIDEESEELGAESIHLVIDEFQNEVLAYRLQSPPGAVTVTSIDPSFFVDDLDELRNIIRAADLNDDQTAELLAEVDTIQRAFGDLIALDADIAANIGQFENIAGALQPLVREIAADAQGEVADAQAAFEESQRIARVVEISVIVVAFVFAVVLIFLINAGLVRPIKTLINTADLFAAGDYDQQVSIVGKDEIGQLGRTFNSMADAVKSRDKSLNAANAQLEQRITEVDQARAEAEQANTVKSQFLASVSHELRTPLNAILNFTKFVATGRMGEVNERQINALNNVIQSGDHLLNLINDVLDISKIESGALSLFIKDDVDVKKELERTVETAQSLISEKSIKIVTQIDDNLPLLTGDELRIYQIILNLVSNACKFTKEGEINVRAYQENGSVVVAVKDTGPGIPLEDQERIFSAFVQSESGLRDGTGTGLGLPIAKRLTEAHGGRLWLNSELGKGTTFFIAIPIQNQLTPTQV